MCACSLHFELEVARLQHTNVLLQETGQDGPHVVVRSPAEEHIGNNVEWHITYYIIVYSLPKNATFSVIKINFWLTVVPASKHCVQCSVTKIT